MVFLLFFVCLAASTAGAIAGFGGGVIIKPVLDAIGVLPVTTISFCSGCTVLAMSASSLIRTRGNGVKVRLRISTPLAVGAALGGLLGSWLFQLVLNLSGRERVLGGVQSICLTLINLGVFVYLCFRRRLPSHRLQNIPATAAIGLILGAISSFLGIGGGPCNMMVLFFFFSLDVKEAAKNSLYIIMFSQIAGILSSIVTGTVPDFTWPNLIVMMIGGVAGAMVGAPISRRMRDETVDRLLRVMLVIVIGIGAYNVGQFFPR